MLESVPMWRFLTRKRHMTRKRHIGRPGKRHPGSATWHKAPPGKRHVAQSAMRVESATHKNHTLIPNWSGMNTKKFNSSVVPSLLAAAGGTVSRRTSLRRDGKMMLGAGAVALDRLKPTKSDVGKEDPGSSATGRYTIPFF